MPQPSGCVDSIQKSLKEFLWGAVSEFLPWTSIQLVSSGEDILVSEALDRSSLWDKGPEQAMVYASEADVLNMALFGMTAKQWRDSHPDMKGNIRDYANVSQLVCLSNLENLNAVFIGEGMSQAERLAKLNAIAISQMEILTQDHRLEQLDMPIEDRQET